MELEQLFGDLVSLDRMLWVIGGGQVVSENTASGMKEPTFSDGYATVEADSWHFHLKTSSVEAIQFVETEDHGVPYLYYVRFFRFQGRDPVEGLFPQPLSGRK